MMDFDVIVVGGGPAGLAFARALNGSGLRLAVVERQSLATLADPPCDGREIALTHHSAHTLQALGAWAHIPEAEIAPLRAAHVLNGGSPFVLPFDPAGTREEQLGWLVPNYLIRRALFQAAQGQAGLTLLADTRVAQVATSAQQATVTLEDGRTLAARLLVAADSRFSQTRDQLGIGAEVNRLGRSMLVARVAHEKDHEGIATEWFDYGQTLAILPLNGRQAGAVLTLAADRIERIAALPRAELGAELTRRFHARLGAMEVIEGPHVYPLATTWSRHFAATRAALIGDTAVGMHPVTAHGFNLGLQSATRLAELVAGAAAHGRDIASPLLLRRYEAAHRLAAGPLYAGTNALVGLYTAEHAPARIARHATLRFGAKLPIFRHGVSRLLMQR